MAPIVPLATLAIAIASVIAGLTFSTYSKTVNSEQRNSQARKLQPL